MWRLTRMLPWRGRAHAPPSRFVYFVQLMFLIPVRRELFVLLCLPIILAVLAMSLLQTSSHQDHVATLFFSVRSAFVKSSNYVLDDAIITGASPGLREQIREQLAAVSGQEGMATSVVRVREGLLSLAATKDVAIRVQDNGRLLIDVVEKKPAFVWHIDDTYILVDDTGEKLLTIEDRYSHPDLFLIAGAGANNHTLEAQAIYSHSWKLTQMIRGLVRIGERRWDIVLDRGRVIMLPERDPLAALVLLDALNESSDLYDLYLAVIDLRHTGQIVVRRRRDQ